MKNTPSNSKTTSGSGAVTGYEAELWAMADAQRGSMDAAEYKHVVLGLIFLKYVSDAFEEHRRHVPRLEEQNRPSRYADVPGFVRSATVEEVHRHKHMLTPGRYRGVEPPEEDEEPFTKKMTRLSAQWRTQQAEAARLDAAIEENLARLGFGSPVEQQ